MSEFGTITSDGLKNKLDSEEGFLLVDTLGEQSYQRAHLPQAVCISAKEDDFTDRVAEAVTDKSQEVIVYCGSFDCGLSPQAAQDLVDAGFENVVDFEGGLKDWAEHGYELEGEDADEVAEELSSE
jgi:rhodanese-related sulfurtransferase